MEKRQIFRKAALDRLASPEELDQAIRILGSGQWAALLAIIVFCGGAAVWAITAQLPTTVIGSGMIVRSAGVLNVVARGAGLVQALDVSVGQRVEANQVVATIAQPTLSDRVRVMRDELAQLTFDHERQLKQRLNEIDARREAMRVQRANTERSITDLGEEVRVAAEQLTSLEQLAERGIVTSQQVITARQRVVQLNGQVEERKAQLKQFDAQALELDNQPTALEAQGQAEIATRRRSIDAALKELSTQETVTSPSAGDVLEIKVSPGGVVAANTPILSLQPLSDRLEAITYLSSLQAKDIKPGMTARISPSTVKREEYGFMWGKVAFVADYPATLASLMRHFQNEQLSQSLMSRGPITEVRIALEIDPQTPSGFRWSSPTGPRTTISSGTLATTEIVSATRAPITLVVPILRQTLGL